ncbi:MAG: hypothetical protein ACPG31_02700 [Planctomycetota bacterium]
MLSLTLGFLRGLIGTWWIPAFALALFAAASLSFDPSLGSHTLGTYLAYVSLLLTIVIFRCGWLLQRRAEQGWPEEERLRDPSGRRAPIAEFLACTILTVGLLGAALIPPLLPMFPQPPASTGLYPVHVMEHEEGQWLIDLGGKVPPTATLHLTLDWSAVAPTDGAFPPIPIQSPDARTIEAEAGKLFAWPLAPGEAAAGKMVLQAPAGSKVAVRRSLARLEIPRPDRSDLGRLLAAQGLFFLPLFAILLAWFRFGRVRGSLSALATFTIGSLATLPLQPMDLGNGPAALLAKIVLLLKLAMPPIEGLVATGQRFERLADTTAPLSTTAWLVTGGLCLFLACRRRPPRKG